MLGPASAEEIAKQWSLWKYEKGLWQRSRKARLSNKLKLLEWQWYKLYSHIKRGGCFSSSKETSFIQEDGEFDDRLHDRYKYEWSGKNTIEAYELNELVDDKNVDSGDSQHQNNLEGFLDEPGSSQD